ncbi:MAG: radical SAM protein [Candidatus Caenarcaniphilales bacterium]|nr:radical SAM protein [Candidatus Caenarcaniphilales bacterium]
MLETSSRPSYIYGPVISWRTGTSLGIDPIGEISTCSFNCSYCQLGKIQNITRERKVYVETSYIIEDLLKAYRQNSFHLNNLDVITFAGSGEPTLALNFGEVAKQIKEFTESEKAKVPLSILTNATSLDDETVIKDLENFDLISLKLDAVDELSLKSINQAEESISVEKIIAGIKNLKDKSNAELQLQIMFLPKFANDNKYIDTIADKIIELGISKIQINTPNRAKPKSGKNYWIETRGNHYAEAEKTHIDESSREYIELPVISQERAFYIEDRLQEKVTKFLKDFSVINVYKKQ